MQLQWTTALVTGGSRGIGRGIALKLAEHGVRKVAINYLENDAAANDTLRLLRERGADGVPIRADVSKADDLKRIFSQAKRELGGLDVFVHNARPSPAVFYQPPLDISLEGWRAAFDS